TVIRRRRDRRAAASSPAAAYFLTWLIAAASSHDARFSSRCILAGVRSPACSATVQPFRDGKSLTSAFTYFPACSHVCVRAKHDRTSPSGQTSPAAPAVPLSWHQQPPCLHLSAQTHDPGAAALISRKSPEPSRHSSSGTHWRLPY